VETATFFIAELIKEFEVDIASTFVENFCLDHRLLLKLPPIVLLKVKI